MKIWGRPITIVSMATWSTHPEYHPRQALNKEDCCAANLRYVKRIAAYAVRTTYNGSAARPMALAPTSWQSGLPPHDHRNILDKKSNERTYIECTAHADSKGALMRKS